MATILQLINENPNLSLFIRGLKTTGLEAQLKEAGPFTALVPVNFAFGRLEPLTYEQLLLPANQEELLGLLRGYVLPEKRMLHAFKDDQKLLTLNGQQITVALRNGETRVNGAKILAHNRQASNGVVHVLDATYETNKPL